MAEPTDESTDANAKEADKPAKSEADLKREKFLSAMKGNRNQDAGWQSHEDSPDGTRRRRSNDRGKGKVRRRPRKV